MNAILLLLGGVAALALAALFAGSQAAVHGLSRSRLAVDVERQKSSALWVARILRDPRALGATVLVGWHVCAAAALYLLWLWLDGVRSPGVATGLALSVLAPTLLVFCDWLPRELARARPHDLLGWAAPALALSKSVFWPLVWCLERVRVAVERLAGLQPVDPRLSLGRERLVELLEEGAESGAIPTHARELARNAMNLRLEVVAKVMVPWAQVERVDGAAPDGALRKAVGEARHTRLPAVDRKGEVLGYFHQLEVLGAGPAGGLPGEGIRQHLRPLPALAPDLALDQALHRMRLSGQRLALVGSPRAPLGILSLSDLLQAITGKLGDP